MNSRLFSPSPFLVIFLVIFLVFIEIPVSLCFDLYSSCSNKFQCGEINVGFPFWGDGRVKGCGYPQLELKCPGNRSITTIDIKGETYNVLSINSDAKSLKIIRKDFVNGICPPEWLNTTFDFRLFDFGHDYTNITLLYGCPQPQGLQFISPTIFNCTVNGFTNNGGYFESEPVAGPTSCNLSVVVPVPSIDLGDVGNPSKIEEVSKKGFEVKCKEDIAAACRACTASKGVCGYDLLANQQTCYCPDQSSVSYTCPQSAQATRAPPVKNVALVIGFAIAGSTGIVGMLLGFWIYSCVLQRKSSNLVIRKRNMKSNEYVKAFIMNQGSLAPIRYSYSEIKKMTNSFINKLGQGGYGSVYKGKLMDGRLVAVKVIADQLNGSGEEFINEVASISRTSHVNIVTLLGFCYDKSKRALIYEFMPNGSLDKFIYNQESSTTNCQLELKTLFQIAVGVARGLEYLHRGCSTRILHFDIKPQNILLDEDFCPKISDFGLAKLCQKKESIVSMMGARGTAGYIAPEVFSRSFGGVSHKSDVYSYGMLVLDMVGGRKNVDVGESQTSEAYFPNYIYKNLNLDETVGNNGIVTEEGEEIERKMILLSLWCIQTIPADRPSMTKVVEMLEGTLESIQIPPKPFLFSPTRSVHDASTTSLS